MMAMIAAPVASAVQPARTARGSSRAPIALPTRTAPADDSPSGTMNASAAMLSAIWCDPDETGSSLPASAVAAAKTPHLQRHLRRGWKARARRAA
jgi:hypothetical protein